MKNTRFGILCCVSFERTRGECVTQCKRFSQKWLPSFQPLQSFLYKQIYWKNQHYKFFMLKHDINQVNMDADVPPLVVSLNELMKNIYFCSSLQL